MISGSKLIAYLGENNLLRLRVKDLVKRKLNSGYPRAQYLGLGFLAFMSTIFPWCLSCGRMEMFADDTTLYCIGNSIDGICSKIQTSINM